MKNVKPGWYSLLLILFILSSAALSAEEDPTQGLPHAFVAGWEGMETCKLLYEDVSVRVGKCDFPPGVGHEKHYHNPHFGYVIEGSTMLVKAHGAESEVSTEAGMSWSTDTLTVHEALNTGSTTASYLIVEPRLKSVE